MIINCRLKRIKQIIISYMLLLICIISIYPIILTISNSFMGEKEIRYRYIVEKDMLRDSECTLMTLIPDEVTLEQYTYIFFNTPIYIKLFWNSIKLTIPIVLGQVIISLIVAYLFTVVRLRYKEVIYYVYIIVMLMPVQVTLVPNYIMADIMNIKNSNLAIILPYIFSPFGVVLLRQYMKYIPFSYIEAAKVDGANHIYILIRIVAGMLKSGIVTLLLLTCIDSWNIVDQAIVFIKEAYNEPLSLFLSRISKSHIGITFAASTFYIIPIVLLFFYGQEHLKKGIKISGLKG